MPSLKKDRTTEIQEFLAHLGLQLRAARMKKGMSQAAVQDKHGIDRAYVSEIELGHKAISVVMLFKLCSIYEIEMSSLLQATEYNLYIDPPKIKGRANEDNNCTTPCYCGGPVTLCEYCNS